MDLVSQCSWRPSLLLLHLSISLESYCLSDASRSHAKEATAIGNWASACVRNMRSSDRQLVFEATDELIDRHNEVGPVEAAAIAEAIAASGATLRWLQVFTQLTDSASTGGLGSMSTLVTPYLLVQSGCYVPKISALGSVDGAIDSLSLIPGFRAYMSEEHLKAALHTSHMFHIQQGKEICPSDRWFIERRRQRNAMGFYKLAAMSLLSKKLAVPGTAVCFDFRSGPTGNVGGFGEARSGAEFFLKVAGLLHIKCSVAITDHRFPVCSFIGRLASLRFLAALAGIRSEELLELDRIHLGTCQRIAQQCIEAAEGPPGGPASSGMNFRQVLGGHLAAQGASEEGLVEMISERRNLPPKVYFADKGGFWNPPSLSQIRSWFQAVEDPSRASVRLFSEGLQKVRAGDPLIEVRGGDSGAVGWLMGSIEDAPVDRGPQIVEILV